MNKNGKQQPEATSRIESVDFLKSLAIYLVIIYHCNAIPLDFIQDNNGWIYFNYFIKSLFSTCVPLFFFINGILLFRKKEINLRAHIYKTIRIIILTVAWSVLIIVLLSLMHGNRIDISRLLKSIWVLQPGTTHLWFLKVLVVIYIFYPLLFTVYQSNRKIFYFFFICVVLFTFGNTLIGDLATVVSYFTGTFTDINLRINYWAGFNPFKDTQTYAIGYFMLGGIVYHYQAVFNSRKFRIIAIIALLLSTTLLFITGIIASLRVHIIWDTVYNGYNTCFTLVNVLAIYILSLNYKQRGKIGKMIILTGKNSFGVYLIHLIIIHSLNPFYFQIRGSTTLLFSMLYAGVILLCSLTLVVALQKIPLVKYLFIIK